MLNQWLMTSYHCHSLESLCIRKSLIRRSSKHYVTGPRTFLSSTQFLVVSTSLNWVQCRQSGHQNLKASLATISICRSKFFSCSKWMNTKAKLGWLTRVARSGTRRYLMLSTELFSKALTLGSVLLHLQATVATQGHSECAPTATSWLCHTLAS